MKYPLSHLAALSVVDLKLDELNEDFGDLPRKIKEAEIKATNTKTIVDETTQILEEVRIFISTSQTTLLELKTKEEKLAKQQFLVRNNKEFDAITKEIDIARQETNRISVEMRNAIIKEENLINMLETQKKDALRAKDELEEVKEELNFIENDQDDERKQIKDKRIEIIKLLEPSFITEYERIRQLHKDAVVLVKRNSCTGCYSQVPPQKNVEIRTNLEKIFYCENCGRMLFPEDLEVDQSVYKL